MFVQALGQVIERIEQRLASRDDDSLRLERGSALDDLVGRHERVAQRIPRILGVAPATPHIAAAQANEIGGFARVKSLTLNGVEILDQRQSTTFAEIGIGTTVTH